MGKYYVVWAGRKTGIFDSWAACKEQIDGFPAARYKSFETMNAAQAGWEQGPPPFSPKKSKTLPTKEKKPTGNFIVDSIAVDAAWNTATGDMEYQGVIVRTGQQIFHQGPFHDGTNNIGEFLAIVHALGYCKQKGWPVPIYSDSRVAIGWVKKKEARTKADRTPRNTQLFELLDRAHKWLRSNDYPNALLKWETSEWGENPADFGRK